MDSFVLGLIVIAYLLVIVLLGIKGYKDTKSAKDFLVAGGDVHPYIMAVSYGATFISTSAIIGFGGVSAIYGMGTIWLTLFNILFGVLLAFAFFGKKTRRLGHKLKAHSFPEFLGNRFKSKAIQKTSGLLIFLAMPLYAAVVLIGGARFIESVFDLDFAMSLIFFAVVIAAYVIGGGLKGVMYTDAMQGTIMFITMFFLLYITYDNLGGVVAAHEALSNMADLVPEGLKAKGHIGWTSYPTFNSSWWWTLTTNIILGVGIGVIAQPQLIVRFLTVKSDRELNQGVLIGSLFIFVAVGFIFTCGALSNVYFMQNGGQLALEAAGGNIDKIIPTYINSALPEWLVYIFMLALLSAGMSTLSSQFHTMGTSLGRDFFEVILPKGKYNTVLLTKISILVSILVSIIVGYLLPPSFIATGTAIFFGICAATFLPAYMAALYSKSATAKGVKVSMATGLIASLFCLLFIHAKESSALGVCEAIFGVKTLASSSPWMLIDPIVYALPMSTLALILVTQIDKYRANR